MHEIRAYLPDFKNRRFYKGVLKFSNDGIVSLLPIDTVEDLPYLLPGLVDAHVHIESSMLIPSRFAELAVRHGTVATVSDPHEIANVLGKEGVRFMKRDADDVPLKIHFTAPSCVPATDFEQAGDKLTSKDIAELLDEGDLVALGEMMNFPGVVMDFPDVIEKIQEAVSRGLPVDGHAPGLTGKDLEKYVAAGISTDHEAVNAEEAREKIALGMKILIREGSAAKNFEALAELITEFPDEVMLCCDDLHPDDLMEGHINLIIRRGLEMGLNIFDLLKASSANPISHYGLNVGQLKPGDSSDFILVDSLESMSVLSTWINGTEVYAKGTISFSSLNTEQPNKFISEHCDSKDFRFYGESGTYRVIEVVDGSLFTLNHEAEMASVDGLILPDTQQDILKLVVVNRYNKSKPAVAWIKNFGLKQGAIGSSVAHDSHNIIVVGCSDDDISDLVNELIDSKGGIAISKENQVEVLSLPIGGIMSNLPGVIVGESYRQLSDEAKKLGSKLKAPFMTLSFMALLVIPELKLGDQGLFDGNNFTFVNPKIS
ncbi:MAG: adenine deaminase [Bacteroidales bacterium]|nr:adenine deaminase [Bacteroidales bacterium]